VHAVISARLAQLSDSARATVSLAATIGREFTLDVLIQASDDDVDSLVGSLDELWQRRIVREHGTSAYDFSHDKLREVAYAEMSAVRRLTLHRRVARALEEVYAANLDAVSAQVATHYEQGGLAAQAVPYFQLAAGLAQRVYANAEAILLLNKGLALLASRPASQDRDELELALQTALGTSLVATAGYGASETLRVYTRSQELCQHLGKPPSPPVLRALAIASLAQAEFQQAHGLGDHLLSLATRDHDPVLLVEGHYVLGVSCSGRARWRRRATTSSKRSDTTLPPGRPTISACTPRIRRSCASSGWRWICGCSAIRNRLSSGKRRPCTLPRSCRTRSAWPTHWRGG
jgi:hypothetical protein